MDKNTSLPTSNFCVVEFKTLCKFYFIFTHTYNTGIHTDTLYIHTKFCVLSMCD